jgi:N-acetyl-anhydromuramyl-L-alanine amidase AmpD
MIIKTIPSTKSLMLRYTCAWWGEKRCNNGRLPIQMVSRGKKASVSQVVGKEYTSLIVVMKRVCWLYETLRSKKLKMV